MQCTCGARESTTHFLLHCNKNSVKRKQFFFFTRHEQVWTFDFNYIIIDLKMKALQYIDILHFVQILCQLTKTLYNYQCSISFSSKQVIWTKFFMQIWIKHIKSFFFLYTFLLFGRRLLCECSTTFFCMHVVCEWIILIYCWNDSGI